MQVSKESDKKCELIRINEKQLMGRQMHGRTDGRMDGREPRHDISSSGFWPEELQYFYYSLYSIQCSALNIITCRLVRISSDIRFQQMYKPSKLLL